MGKRLILLQDDEVTRIVIKGKVGRVGMSTGGRIYPSLMAREVQKICVGIRNRWKRGLTDQDPISVQAIEDTHTVAMLYEEQIGWKRHDNGMEAMAEACCTPDEVKAFLLPKIEAAFRRAKKTHSTVREARNEMWLAADKFLGQHFFVLPQRKKTIERWSKRYLSGYQKWYRRVASEEKRIRRRMEKTGVSTFNAKARALLLVSPELYDLPCGEPPLVCAP